ncbi:bifunctional DNA-formamidopyrimidine glycosylase/DNA-(apurinic or apyrimidinic site) lyase [Candidatus Nomurabacteria bacterium]|nr:bifunctional DNA-formamidopyrimidine glycosylase/DNA-(apurinic or apyrimidinic site) lyase [Candidatus Nomurabacteria bacterium]
MPELPEVQTTVDGINRRAKGQIIKSVWTDLAVSSPIKQFVGTLKDLSFYKKFQKLVSGAKILKAERRAKNILIHLSNGYTILVHMKMTGHMMYGKYDFDKKKNPPAGGWTPHVAEKNIALRDPYNRFIHVVFSLSNEKHLVLSDVRKFAKVTLIKTNELLDSIHLKHHGPEPLNKNFSLAEFKQRLLKKPNTYIKQALLDPKVVSGIGNIYGDELLWESGVHPLRKVKDISQKEFVFMFNSMKNVLQKGIDFGGDSMSDYRDIDGKRGKFQNDHNAYRLTGKSCKKRGCKGKIERVLVGARSAHFCNVHQK